MGHVFMMNKKRSNPSDISFFYRISHTVLCDSRDFVSSPNEENFWKINIELRNCQNIDYIILHGMYKYISSNDNTLKHSGEIDVYKFEKATNSLQCIHGGEESMWIHNYTVSDDNVLSIECYVYKFDPLPVACPHCGEYPGYNHYCNSCGEEITTTSSKESSLLAYNIVYKDSDW